jgi:hypothetical protein
LLTSWKLSKQLTSTTEFIMNNSSTVLKEMQSLRQTWRTQNFTYTKDQQERYDELLELRKAFINFWKEEGRVWVGPSNIGKKKEEEKEEN